MIEKDISIGSGKNRLCGTVCLPQDDGRFPVVLMLHGSGPFDRDENIRWHGLNIMRLEVFNTLARFLAGKGIASVRYDKRGCGKSSGNYWEAGYFDLVDDAVTWVEALAKFDFCDPSKVILLGHSEGCDIAAHVHARCP